MTLTPAYGRDYKSKAEVQADWDADKDFIIADVHDRYSGKPVNKSQLAGRDVWIRYKQLRSIVQVQKGKS